MNKNITILLIMFFLAAGVFTSGCLSGDADEEAIGDAQSSGTDADDSYSQDEIYSQASTQAYTLFAGEINFNDLYVISGSKGDSVDINAYTDAPADFIFLDDGYISGDRMEGHIIEDLTVWGGSTYSQSIVFEQGGFFYLVVGSSEFGAPISGEIEATKYSSFEQTSASTGSSAQDYSTYYTNANDVADKSKELAEEARAKSDEWAEETAIDRASYFD